MDFNSTENVTQSRSVFFCSQMPAITWELDNTTFAWILVVILSIASPVTILLNSLVIIAVKKKKELQKHSNILLVSLAVADLLVGAVTMPSSATVDILILRQVSFEHICTLEWMVTKPITSFLFESSLYHFTVIAWERYMAIQKWMDYQVIVTKTLLRELALAAWLLVVLKVSLVGMIGAGVEIRVAQLWRISQSAVVVCGLVVITYFYAMVYLGVRKRKINEISNVTEMMKAEVQSKVAKTTAMLTAALIISFIPSVVIPMLGNISSVFRTNSAFPRLMEAMVHLNSLVTPILYCYRDRPFRKAVLELLGIRKSRRIQPAVDASRSIRRTNPFGSLELQNVQKPRARTKSASCDPAADLDCVHSLGTPHGVLLLRRSISAPKLNECSGSLPGPNLHQPSSVLTSPQKSC